ncbi:hypothetical protein SAY87_032258 [Trapa incisa]|uniref:Uncharacterized protein n=1 Tax=Trapa incisa TaxID=236973 RepID=A0AAN7GK94_9MYRT|nr:hypothetical protein SAY87_032258 [Trapa incisa]
MTPRPRTMLQHRKILFASSDKLNEPEELVNGFKKSKDSLPTDLIVALVGLETGPGARDPAKATAASASDGKAPLEDVLVQKTDMEGPRMFIYEEINVEFRESLLARVGLMGVVYLRTLPPKGDKETKFSFHVNSTSSVRQFVI